MRACQAVNEVSCHDLVRFLHRLLPRVPECRSKFHSKFHSVSAPPLNTAVVACSVSTAFTSRSVPSSARASYNKLAPSLHRLLPHHTLLRLILSPPRGVCWCCSSLARSLFVQSRLSSMQRVDAAPRRGGGREVICGENAGKTGNLT